MWINWGKEKNTEIRISTYYGGKNNVVRTLSVETKTS